MRPNQSDCSNCRNKGKYIYTSNFTGKRVISSVPNRHPLGGGQKPCDELMMQFRNKHGLRDCTEVVCNDYSPKPGLPMPDQKPTYIGTPISTDPKPISTPKPPKGIKPPMDVKPRFIVADERLSELREAIRMHMYSNLHLPIEWIDEYNEVIAYLDSRKDKR